MTSLLPGLLALRFLVPGVIESHSRSQVCHPMDASGESVFAWVRSVATQTDGASAEQRAMMHLSRVPADRVGYVTDERICRGVLSEYNRYSGTRDATTGAGSAPSEQVCVVEVGSVYVVTDPTKVVGEFITHVTVDRHFRMLAYVLG